MPSFETPADIFTRLSVFDSPEGSSNTFKTHKNISLYFKRRYLIRYNYIYHTTIYHWKGNLMGNMIQFNPIAYGGGGGGFLACAIRLAARTLEPFHLESPKFLFSFLVHVPIFFFWVAGSEDFACATLFTTPLDFQSKF